MPASPEAVICVADCASVIVKPLREGEDHAFLLHVCLRHNAGAAKLGVWLAATLPAYLELQLAVPTTVYDSLQAFHDLRWRGKPDRQLGATHWQEWLQGDPQRDAVQGLGPAPATRALDAFPAPLAGAAHGSAGQPTLRPGAAGRHLQVGAAPSGKGGHGTQELPLMCGQVLHKRGMLKHLAWHAVLAAAPAEDKEAASHVLQGRARRSQWHVPYAQRPPPQERPARWRPRGRKRRHPTRPREPAVQFIRGPSPRAWPPCGPLWERAPQTPWPRHTPGTWLSQQTHR